MGIVLPRASGIALRAPIANGNFCDGSAGFVRPSLPILWLANGWSDRVWSRPLLSEQRLHVLEHRPGVAVEVKADGRGGVVVLPDTVGIDDDRDPARHRLRLALRRAVVQRQLALRVTPQLELEGLYFFELGVLLRGVERATNDLNADLVELVLTVAEPATFSRSAKCGGRWVKPQHRPLAFERVCLRQRSGGVLHR